MSLFFFFFIAIEVDRKLTANVYQIWSSYRKISKISPKALFEGLIYGSLIVGSKFAVLALFYLEGRFNGGFFALPVWVTRGLFSEFYGS